MRGLVLLISFASLCGCSYLAPKPEQSKPVGQGAERSTPSKLPLDSQCYSDCMSDQASEQLCRRRCAY